MNDKQIATAAVIAARINGCNCDVEVELELIDGVHHAHLSHDGWCALLKRIDAPWN